MVAKAFLMKLRFQILNSMELGTSLADCDLSHMQKIVLKLWYFGCYQNSKFEKVKISIFKFLVTFIELFWDLKTCLSGIFQCKLWKICNCSSTLSLGRSVCISLLKLK